MPKYGKWNLNGRLKGYSFYNYWPDDGLLRPKLVANSRITLLYICVRRSTNLFYFTKGVLLLIYWMCLQNVAVQLVPAPGNICVLNS